MISPDATRIGRAGHVLLGALILVLASGFLEAFAQGQMTTAAGAASSGFQSWGLRGSASLPVGTLAIAAHSETFMDMLAQPLRRALIVLHVLGTTIGFGAALFLDLFLLRILYRRALDGATLQLVRFGSRLVSAGLGVLWLSGAGFLTIYSLATPDLLSNPKIWAKLSVVVLLTLNGIYLHRRVFNALEQRIGRPLMAEISARDAFAFIIPATLSATGWAFAFVLGLVKELNNTATVNVFLSVYCGVLLSAVLTAWSAHWFAARPAVTNRLRYGVLLS